MISTKKNVDNINSKYAPFTVGVHTGVDLDSIEVATTTTGKPYLKLRFIQKEDRMAHTHMIWYPSGTATPRNGESNAQANEREVNSFLDQIVTLLMAFGYTDKEATISADNVESLGDIFVTKMKQKIGKAKVNVILQEKKDSEYVEFPRYNFIEIYEEGKPSKLKAVQAKTANSNKLSTAPAIDDLPF